jgi:hypothetical protein
MPITFDPSLVEPDRQQLCDILGVTPRDLDARLAALAGAATLEYVEQFLGRKVFTRGSDIREYRLFLLIRYLFDERIPSEDQVSALFQTTASQSRALIRAVSSKYQYDLATAREATLKAAVEAIGQPANAQAGSDWSLDGQSDYVIEALNAVVSRQDGTLTRLIRSQGTASSYVVRPATRTALRSFFGIA